jgi:outer membrane protein assembly factor BamA
VVRAPLTQGVRIQGQNQAKNLSIKIYSSAKFHQDLSSSSDFYKEEIYIKLYILDVQNE